MVAKYCSAEWICTTDLLAPTMAAFKACKNAKGFSTTPRHRSKTFTRQGGDVAPGSALAVSRSCFVEMVAHLPDTQIDSTCSYAHIAEMHSVFARAKLPLTSRSIHC